jgi:hypothetical protein
MAVVNFKSTMITNADATPLVRSPRYLTGTKPNFAETKVSVAAGDDDTSVFRVIRVNSNAYIFNLFVTNTAITGGTSYDLGVYQTAANGGAVVDADLFGAAVDMSSARVTPIDAK